MKPPKRTTETYKRRDPMLEHHDEKQRLVPIDEMDPCPFCQRHPLVGQMTCNSIQPKTCLPFCCTRKRGHNGKHVACAPDVNGYHNIAQWW